MKADPLPYLLFSIANQDYALAIAGVVEVAAMVELVETPGTDAIFVGIANRHGAVLPMLDLRPIFHQSASKIDMSTLFIVVQADKQMAGLVVDAIHQIEYVMPGQVSSSKGREQFIEEIITHDERLIQVVALPALLAAYLPQNVPEYVESER